MTDADATAPWEPLSIGAVAEVFAATNVRWWLSGGVDLDLWLGRSTREHGDIDVSVLSADWTRLAADLPGDLEAFAAIDGRLQSLRGTQSVAPFHNVWVRRTGSTHWVLQINLEEGDESVWRYRRLPTIEREWPVVVALKAGMPIVNPAVQLLWKARDPVGKDEADFAAVSPLLDERDRLWLAAAIGRAHPESSWPARLGGAAR